MDIRVLRYFLAVAREGNITKAAERLHLSQPTLSVQLQALERELGKPLFQRKNRRLMLTEEGYLLQRRAGEIIGLVEQTAREILCADETVSGSVSIGSGDTKAMAFAIQSAAQLKKRFPAVQYHLFSGDAAAIAWRLDKGLLEFGIIPEPVNPRKYASLPLALTTRWGLLMPKDHPLSRKQRLCAGDMADIPLILPQRKELQEEISGWLPDVLQQLHITATYTLFYIAPLLVRAGFGCALLLDKQVYARQDDLCFRPLLPSREARLSLVWKKYTPLSAGASAFLEQLKKTAEADTPAALI